MKLSAAFLALASGADLHANGICSGTDGEYTTAYLNANYKNIPSQLTKGKSWYTHKGLATGICGVRDVTACENVCKAVDGCTHFSMSLTQNCYACFIHKSCDTPSTKIGHGYKVYKPESHVAKTNAKGICSGTDKDYTVSYLKANYPDVPKTLTSSKSGWYTHKGLATGICGVRSVSDCEKVCAAVEGCTHFSMSLTQNCYACFVHKGCSNPSAAIGKEYTSYEMQPVLLIAGKDAAGVKTAAPTPLPTVTKKFSADATHEDSTKNPIVKANTAEPTAVPTPAPTAVLKKCRVGRRMVKEGWRGAGANKNYCNLYHCTSSGLKLVGDKRPCGHKPEYADKKCTHTKCSYTVTKDSPKEKVIQVIGHHAEKGGKSHSCVFMKGQAVPRSNTGICSCYCWGDANVIWAPAVKGAK